MLYFAIMRTVTAFHILKAAIKHEAKTQGHYMSLLHGLLAYCELKHINIGG